MGKITDAFAEFGAKRKVFIRKANGTYYAKSGSIDIPKLESDISGINTDISALEANALPSTAVADNNKFLNVSGGKWAKSANGMVDYIVSKGDDAIYYTANEEEVEAGHCWWTKYKSGLIEIDGHIVYTVDSSQQLGNGWYYKYTPLFKLPASIGIKSQISSVAMLMKGHTVGFISCENHDLLNTSNATKLQYLMMLYGNASSTLTEYTIGFHVLGSTETEPYA